MNPGRNVPYLLGLALILAVAFLALAGAWTGPSRPFDAVSLSPPAQTPMPTAPARIVQTRTPTQVSGIRASAPPTPFTSFTPAPSATEQAASPTPEGAEKSSSPAQPTAIEGALPIEGTLTPLPQGESEAGQGIVFGHSALGEPLVAYRLGTGPIEVVLAGDIHGAYESNTRTLVQELLGYYQSHLDEIPERVSLWLIPTLNPDGLAAGTRWNANGVDLNRNADTDLDGCAGNDWSPDTVGLEGTYPGAGGSYPFSEPETQALRELLSDAQVTVFYHSAAGAIYADSCAHHLPSARLAQVLSEGTGYPVPGDGWSGYRVTGDFADYLAGEGVAAVTVELTDHEGTEFDRNLEGVRLLLARVDQIIAADATDAGGELAWLDDGVCAVRLARDSLVHPLAAEVIGEELYLLDSGRVLALDVGSGTKAPCTLAEEGVAPVLQELLAPGDSVAGVHVTEPLDLAVTGDGWGATPSAGTLFVLDRAGDVYSYTPSTSSWALERYGRPAIDTGDHYYVALSAWGPDRFLLETTREKVWRFTQGQKGLSWANLPLGRDVDLSATEESVYVLTRALHTPIGDLVLFRRDGKQGDAKAAKSFEPEIKPVKPRQVVATDSGVFVLDRAGRRLLRLDPATGALQVEYLFSDRRAVSAFWAGAGKDDDATGPALILAGRDVLYFYPNSAGPASHERLPGTTLPEEADADTGAGQPSVLPNDPAWLESLRGLAMPIDGATITTRDYQMPGSPRHYRLGVHEGIDFYTGTSGVTIDSRTPVRAVAAGKVIRALLDYHPLTAAQAKAWAAEVVDLGYTPPDILDGYRGRQVWIEHENGPISHYAHLSAIAPGIVVGASIVQGQVIGLVGNSGTPESVSNPKGELHLHLELWAGESYVGQFLRPIEAREWIEGILR